MQGDWKLLDKYRSTHLLNTSLYKNGKQMDHFWVPFSLFFKVRLSAKYFLWQLGLISMWMKTDIHAKTLHIDSASNRRWSELENGLFETKQMSNLERRCPCSLCISFIGELLCRHSTETISKHYLVTQFYLNLTIVSFFGQVICSQSIINFPSNTNCFADWSKYCNRQCD